MVRARRGRPGSSPGTCGRPRGGRLPGGQGRTRRVWSGARHSAGFETEVVRIILRVDFPYGSARHGAVEAEGELGGRRVRVADKGDALADTDGQRGVSRGSVAKWACCGHGPSRRRKGEARGGKRGWRAPWSVRPGRPGLAAGGHGGLRRQRATFSTPFTGLKTLSPSRLGPKPIKTTLSPPGRSIARRER